MINNKKPYISVEDAVKFYEKLYKLKKSHYPIRYIKYIMKKDFDKLDIKFL